MSHSLNHNASFSSSGPVDDAARLWMHSLAATGKYKVRGLVRNIDKAKEALGDEAGSGVELQRGDILDEESLRPAMKVRIQAFHGEFCQSGQ